MIMVKLDVLYSFKCGLNFWDKLKNDIMQPTRHFEVEAFFDHFCALPTKSITATGRKSCNSTSS